MATLRDLDPATSLRIFVARVSYLPLTSSVMALVIWEDTPTQKGGNHETTVSVRLLHSTESQLIRARRRSPRNTAASLLQK